MRKIPDFSQEIALRAKHCFITGETALQIDDKFHLVVSRIVV